MRFVGSTVVLMLLALLIWMINSQEKWSDKRKNTLTSITLTAMIWIIFSYVTFLGVRTPESICY
jgi:cell division protein FtsW (lipid II flippase)